MLLSNYFDTNATPLQCANNKVEGLHHQGEGLYHLQHNANKKGRGSIIYNTMLIKRGGALSSTTQY